MLSQPRMQSLDNPAAYHVGLALLGVGGVFVLSSFLALGFTGTFLGKTLSAGGQGPAPRRQVVRSPSLMSFCEEEASSFHRSSDRVVFPWYRKEVP